MPAWMHDRAEHILAKNPSMPKAKAFAIATQQSHALGKSPKGFGTAEGHAKAKAKYDTPKDDKYKANPGGLTSPKLEKKAMDAATFAAFSDELRKLASEKDSGFVDSAKKVLTTPIPHTPELFGGIKNVAQQATRGGGMGNGGASAGFKKWEAARMAAH